MNKDELLKEIQDDPGIMQIEIAIQGKNGKNTVYRKAVAVKRHHDNIKGRDTICLVCLKSLKEQAELFGERREATQETIKQAAILYAQQEQEAERKRRTEQIKKSGYNFNGCDFGNFGKGLTPEGPAPTCNDPEEATETIPTTKNINKR